MSLKKWSYINSVIFSKLQFKYCHCSPNNTNIFLNQRYIKLFLHGSVLWDSFLLIEGNEIGKWKFFSFLFQVLYLNRIKRLDKYLFGYKLFPISFVLIKKERFFLWADSARYTQGSWMNDQIIYPIRPTKETNKDNKSIFVAQFMAVGNRMKIEVKIDL